MPVHFLFVKKYSHIEMIFHYQFPNAFITTHCLSG